MTRVWRFILVGTAGFGVQLAVLAALLVLGRWPWLPATIAAVEAAIVHNFLWHERWTWRGGTGPALARFARFNAATAATSIAGNAVFTGVFIELCGCPPLVANALAVALLCVCNFALADRWVFAVPVAAIVMAPVAAAAAPASQVVEEWRRYVTAAERTPVTPGHSNRFDISATGASVHVRDATISDWRGAVFVPRITLEALLHDLQNPGTPPPQEDIVSSHVIDRGPQCLRVFIRLVRRAVVTVTYDTEHEMTFSRVSPTRATARSVATRIEEAGGGDHGFLWKLNSYWTYEQVDGGVWVDLRSLTLSRGVPAVVRPVAVPIVSRIAQESIVRTLDALRRYLTR